MSIFKGPSFTSRADKITQFQATTCDFGTAVPYLYGTCKVNANLIEYKDFETKEKRTTTKSGKSKSTQIDYLYYAKLVLAIGEGNSGLSLGSVWVNNKKFSSLSTMNASTDAGPTLTFMPNGGKPYDANYAGTALCYGRVYLGTNSASVPSYGFEVNGLLRSTGDGKDANAAQVIKHLLQQCGMGNNIDADSFSHFERFCHEAGLNVSTPAGVMSQQKKAQEIIKALLDLTNTYMFWSVDKFKFVPRYPARVGDWTPDTTIQYVLNKNDFTKDSFQFKRTDSSQQFNIVKVNFTNRNNEYETESVSFINADDVREKGTKQTEVDAPWLHSKVSAVKLAKMKAEMFKNEVTTYDFGLDWCFARLEPGDLVQIQDETLNINEVVRISKIVENSDGTIKVTAISTPISAYGSAVYTVRDDYQYVDFNVAPGSIAPPLFIIPPTDLVTSNSGAEIWVALRGQQTSWGGCQVFVSGNDANFLEAGTQSLESLYGKVVADNNTTMTVKLGNIEQKELIEDQTVWINGEVLSYEKAVLTAFNTYRLEGLQRGLHGSTKTTHAQGEDFAILDSALFCLQLTKSDIGKKIYFRFPSFNNFKAMAEDVNQVESYEVLATAADLPNCVDVTAYNKYRELTDDVVRYDIVVEWTPPPGMSAYQQAQVWYKTSGTQAKELSFIQEGVSSNELGYGNQWIYGGQGYNTVVIPQAVVGDTYKIAVCTQDIYGNVETPDVSSQTSILVALKSETPNTPANLGVSLTDTFNIYWDEVRNADVKFYEVRTDPNVGIVSPNLLLRTTETKVSLNTIQDRMGTLYVFAVSAYGKASAPAKVLYNFPKPSAPAIEATAKLQGIECKSSNIPNNCQGIHWYFDGTDTDEDIRSTNNTYFYSAQAGIYHVNACFYDFFGDGEMNSSGEGVMVIIEAHIPAELIASESITLEKLSADAQKAIEEGGLDTVNIAVKGMLGEGSALVMQPSGELALVASNGQELTGLFANQDGVIRLQGDYIDITGQTRIGNNIITKDMIKAGAVTADKMSVTSLSSISATIGTLRTATSGARMELTSNQLRVYDSNNVLRIKLGVF